MAGSMRPRPDKGRDAFELRVFLGRDAEGRVRHRSVLFRGTLRQAERELARMIVDQEDEPSVASDETSRQWGPTTTFNDAIAGWRENGWEDLSPVTARRYESVWKLHVRDGIGRRRISSTSPYDVERYFRQLKSDGAGRETIRYVRSIIHRACRLARKWSGNVLPNPVADTELPAFGLDAESDPVRAPSAEEVRLVLKAASTLDVRYGACLRLVAATGIRRGEACALRWSDVDWETGTIRVDEAVVTARGRAVVKSPKTRASIRTLALDEGTLAVLRELEVEQQRLALGSDEAMGSEAFVFSASLGGATPPYPDTMSRAFLRVRRDAGVDADVHLHSLGHFQATTLDAVIPERQKQARLGWSTMRMARHYTDAVAAEDKRVAEHVGRVLGGSDGTATGE